MNMSKLQALARVELIASESANSLAEATARGENAGAEKGKNAAGFISALASTTLSLEERTTLFREHELHISNAQTTANLASGDSTLFL